MLIRNAELDGVLSDLRLRGSVIAEIAQNIAPLPGEEILQADGGALLPGLHDHHIHLFAAAAALASVPCGPPQVPDKKCLAAALQNAGGEGWVRGIGYHDSIGGIDCSWLDENGPMRPIRIQHRSGRMWIFNSLAIALLGEGIPPDGRLIDGDAWLATRLPALAPDLAGLGMRLARYGVTGLTETTPRNTLETYRHLAEAGLPQHLRIMGNATLHNAPLINQARHGALKLHYHDYDLPPLETLVAQIADAHAANRPVAAHCVTPAELWLTLAAIELAGPHSGDRIEHAAIAGPEAIEKIRELRLTVVTQPHFLAERAQAYRAEVAPADLPYMYRLNGFRSAGIRLAAGSDAPFGGLSPWASMDAAVNRPEGFGEAESLTPEQALALYTGHATDPAKPRRIAAGEPADLCLLERPWNQARNDLKRVSVVATIIGGKQARF